MLNKEMVSTNIFIGERIKGVMAEKQITKAELARRLGIRPQSVEYLLKRKSIDTDTLYNVSMALDYDFSKLYSLNKNQTIYDKSEAHTMTHKAKVVIEIELEQAEIRKLELTKKINEFFGREEREK